MREVHVGHGLGGEVGGELFVNGVGNVAEVTEEGVVRGTGGFCERREVPLSSYVILGVIQVDVSQAVKMAKSKKASRPCSNDAHSI